MSFARLQRKIDELKNPTVVGLDPDLEYVPQHIMDKYIADRGETLDAASLAVIEFNMNLINALCRVVPAIKAQSAYYEMLGPQGVAALKVTCEFAKSRGMYVIVDGKRNDIGSTAAAYSAAYLGVVKVGNTEHVPFEADALTVNAYLGSDGIKPFLKTCAAFDKAVFALVKTSNPSSNELQNLELLSVTDNEAENNSTLHTPHSTLYAAVGDLMESISLETKDEFGYTRIGAVVGATYPKEMEFLRKRLKHTFFLVPGYGAQGGSVEDVKFAFDEHGRGAVVNSSRAIIGAWKNRHGSAGDVNDDFVSAAVEEAVAMRDELRRVL